MTILGRLFERRSLENPAVPLTHASLLDWMTGPASASGVNVNERTALTMAAVWRCVNLISSVSAALPLHTYKVGTKEQVDEEYPVIDDPHPEMTRLEFWRLMRARQLLWGNGYAYKQRNGAGRLTALLPLDPSLMTVTAATVTERNPWGKLFTYRAGTEEERIMTRREVFHLPGFGYDGLQGLSVVKQARNTIGLALAAEEYGSKLFSSGNLQTGILTTDQAIDKDEVAKRLEDRWSNMFTGGLKDSHKTALLSHGTSFQPLSMPAEDSQFLETRSFQIDEVARWFGVPQFLLFQTEKSTSWGTGLEQQAIGWVKFDLQPTWLSPAEQRINKELHRGEGVKGVESRFVVEGLLRGDSAARAQFYRIMREVGAFSANDIRDLENLPPVEGGDSHLQPLNMAPLGTEEEGDEE